MGIDDAAAASLARYVALVLDWGARVNLTGARSAAVLVDEHVADALAVAAQVPAHVRRAVDVGSGAGLPGVVLAILRPGLALTLLEPRRRRWAFLREVRRRLGLENLEPLAERLEEHLGAPDFGPYQVAISRATWPPAEWLERGRPLLEPGGLLIGLEGRERAELPSGTRRLPYALGSRRGAVLVRAV